MADGKCTIDSRVYRKTVGFSRFVVWSQIEVADLFQVDVAEQFAGYVTDDVELLVTDAAVSVSLQLELH